MTEPPCPDCNAPGGVGECGQHDEPAPASLRDQLRRAICEATGFEWDSDMLEPDEYGEHADAVLAVRDTEMQKLHDEIRRMKYLVAASGEDGHAVRMAAAASQRADRAEADAARYRARVAELEAGLVERSALLEEARDALEAAGINEAHGGDSWPRLVPAIEALAADRDRAEAAVDRRPSIRATHR